jgi:ABC-2 type transport system ATP-binding protein
VIGRGVLVAEGSVAELRGNETLLVRAEPLEDAARLVALFSGVEGVEVRDGMLRLSVDPDRAPEIGEKLVAAGVRVGELRPERRSLEEVFLRLTDEEEGGG